MRSRRLLAGPFEAVDRGRPLTVWVDLRPVRAFEGDTIGSAMAAAGILITGRSFKYHRPRGLQCMTGACPNCLVDVDGVPNVRACTEPARDGVRVKRQNAWPSATLDGHRILDRLSFMMPAGFYYKVFVRPRWSWRAVEPLIRRKAGLGLLPEKDDLARRERVNLHPHVLVIGSGPAGLAAAAEAAGAGARTVLIEESRNLGGHLQGAASPAAVSEESLDGLTGIEVAARLQADAISAGAEILAGTPAFGVFDGPLVAAASDRALYRIRAKHVVFATGAIEQMAVFPNNDLPGVMLSRAVDLLLHRYGVRPGRVAVVLGASSECYVTGKGLIEAGATSTVVDLRTDPRGPEVDAFRQAGGRIIPGSTVRRAEGSRRVKAAIVGALNDAGEERLGCDLLVHAGLLTPSTSLLAQCGATLEFDEREQAFLPTSLPERIHAAGEVAGSCTLDAAIAQGRLSGLEAAEVAGFGSADTLRLDGLRRRASERRTAVVLPPEVGAGGGKQFACICMDVTDKELKFAVKEGFDSMELLKRYTTITMGPCQGKACLLASARLCGTVTGRTLRDTGFTTARPPWSPVELGVLASDRLTPRKETSMHDVHADLGAMFMWAGDWRRPHHYADPVEECRAVHERVGLIDVSSLGKFRVKGPQAIELLERLYPNRFGDLKVGRIRYGVMLNDEGVILDDGTVCRLGDDEFFVTVTTGNTEAIERWVSWWQAVWGLDVRVLNVTGGYAAVNLAGPRSRTVMERLTDMEVSAEGLPYLSSARGQVAGVPSLVLRIGFVGELGYEIHFPSAYGEHVWSAILGAGADLGIEPFGLEAQRILRLEKQHILVGQDTDAESDPYEAGLSWLVKLDKPDFLGRRSLAEAQETEPAERLVGFVADPPIVPPEGSAVVFGGRWVGRVTSSRRSATTGTIVGLAWVPAGWAEDGKDFDIKFDGVVLHARVRTKPFYDPDGKRLRS